MASYIIRRLLLMVPTLIGITVLVFVIMAMSPGGIGGAELDQMGQMTAGEREVREYYEQRYGLDKPVPVQYVRWLNMISPVGYETRDDGTLGAFGFKTPNLGTSFSRHRPVSELIIEALPITLLLNALSIPLVYAIGIVSGIITARYRGHMIDVSIGGVFLALWSVPVIWAGVMLIGLLANQQYLQWFPTSGLHDMRADVMPFLPTWSGDTFQRGWLLDTLWHLVLPVICLSYTGFAFLSKLARGSLLENLGADFVRTARAKGVPERQVLFRHAFRNSLLALITVAAGILPAMLGGSIIVETIFSLPGMGRLGVDAVRERDRELLLAVTLIIGFVGLLSELIRDICYAIADPRVSYE
ncbi:MAG: ABC transporter permease [Phycisphaeraceae bacterium]